MLGNDRVEVRLAFLNLIVEASAGSRTVREEFQGDGLCKPEPLGRLGDRDRVRHETNRSSASLLADAECRTCRPRSNDAIRSRAGITACGEGSGIFYNQ